MAGKQGRTIPKSFILTRVNGMLSWLEDWHARTLEALHQHAAWSSAGTNQAIFQVLHAGTIDDRGRKPTEQIPGTLLREFPPFDPFDFQLLTADEEERYWQCVDNVKESRDALVADRERLTFDEIGGRYLQFLRVQLESVREIQIIFHRILNRVLASKKSEIAPSSNSARDAWIYKVYEKKSLADIRTEIERQHPEWEQIATDPGVRMALTRYAKANNLPLKTKKPQSARGPKTPAPQHRRQNDA